MGAETGTGTGTGTGTTVDDTTVPTGDEYRISEPPSTLREFFNYMGPAWVFTASQIGGGEVLSVPLGGAYLGMEGIWLIPLITFTKIFGQYYLVRYGVMTGDTFLDALFERSMWLRWIFYYVFLGGVIYALGLSGHLGETAGAFNSLIPGFGTSGWMVVTVIAGLLIVGIRSYELIEKITTTLLWVFLALIAFVSIQTAGVWGPNLANGLVPSVPGNVEGLGVGGIAFVLTMFGWIGAGFGPTVSYVWFAKDKVMGMFEPVDSGVEIDKFDMEDEEIDRLKGWGDIVLWQNIVSSVILAVFSFFMWTAAAATLHTRGIQPSGFTVIPEMANIFTTQFGEWSAILFLLTTVGALFSTLIGPLYGMSRLWEDAFALHGLFDNYDISRESVFRATIVLFSIIPLGLNLVFEAPLFLFALSGALFAPAIGLMYLVVLYMSFDIEIESLSPIRSWAVGLALFAGLAMIVAGLWEARGSIQTLLGL